MSNRSTLPNIPDDWFIAFKSGNERRYQEVFNLHYRSITYYVSTILGHDHPMVDDVATQTFTLAWDYRGKIETPKHLRNFLFQTARHRSVTFLRSEKVKHRTHLAAASEQPDFEMNPALDLERVQTMLIQKIYESLDQLAHGHVLRMSYLEGKSTEEIANLLNTTPGNVYTLKSRALKELRDLLGKNLFLMALLLLLSALHTHASKTAPTYMETVTA